MKFQQLVSNNNNNNTNFLSLGSVSDYQETDVSNPKFFRKQKYQKNKGARSRESEKSYSHLQYDQGRVISELKRLRKIYGNSNPPEIVELATTLSYIKNRKHKQHLVAHASLPQYGVRLLDQLQSFIKLAQLARDQISEGTLAFLLDLFTALANIFMNPTWTSVMLNLSTLFAKYFPTSYVEYAIEYVRQLFGGLVAQSSGESFAKTLKGMFDLSDSFLNSSLWSNLGEFFVKIATMWSSVTDIVSYETLDTETILAKFSLVKKSILSSKDVIDMAFKSFEFVMANWENIVTGNWSELPIPTDKAQSFETEVRKLEGAFKFAISGREYELETSYGMDLKSFEYRLNKAINTAKNLQAVCSSKAQKMAISNFSRILYSLQSQWFDRLAEAPEKEEPFGIKFAGGSSTGKSFLTTLVSNTMLNAYGFDPAEKGQTVNADIEERYESTVMPTHKIIVCDDVANAKDSKPNYNRVLNYVNTVPRPLEKAEAGDKGRFYPGNVGLIVNTNVDDLNVLKHSNSGESILRRFRLHVDVAIREEFRNTFGGIIDLEEIRNDVHELTLKRFDCIEDGEVRWNVIPRSEWVGDDSVDHDLASFLAFLAKDIAAHKARADRKKEQKLAENFAFCEECGIPESMCRCVMHKDAPTDPNVPQDLVAEVGSLFDVLPTDQLIHLRLALSGCYHSGWTLIKSMSFKVMLYRQRRKIYQRLCFVLLLPFLHLFVGRDLTFVAVFIVALTTYQFWVGLNRELDDKINRRRDQLSSVCETVSQHMERNVLKYFTVGASFYALYRLYNTLKPIVMSSQDATTYMRPSAVIFDQQIDAPKGVLKTQDERNYKEGYSRIPPRMSMVSKTTDSSKLEEMLSKRLRVVTIKTELGILQTVNGMMVSGNVILVPNHLIPSIGKFDIETSTSPMIPSASTKDQNIVSSMVYRLPERDMCLIQLPSAPAGAPLKNFFADEEPNFLSKGTVLLHRRQDGTMVRSRQAISPLYNDNGERRVSYRGSDVKPGFFYGQKVCNKTLEIVNPYQCNLEFNSFSGLCGSPYIDCSKGIIYGFHVAGDSTPDTYGVLNIITRKMLDRGIEQLSQTSHSMVTHSAAEVRVDTYNQPYTIVDAPPLYTREDGTQGNSIVTYLGRVLHDGQELASRARTPYIPTPFKDVEINLGKSKHMPPTKPNKVEKAMKTLNKLTNPVQHYQHDILERAVTDYRNQTVSVVRANKEELHSILRIYTQEEAMDGTGDGIMSGLPNATSAGFPINKSKMKCLVRDPMDESLPTIPRQFNKDFDIQSEIDRTLNAWSEGLRSETIYKASSKVNELLPNAKAADKVRKFYGSPFANFVASRMALGGVPEFMRRYWRDTECLVGVNPTSLEWQEFHDFLTAYSDKNMIAGDFAGFDTRMAAQITTCAASIIVSWYEEAGCSEDEIALIKGALSDIVHPNILFEGDLYRFANGNPSGNMITVQLNSVCNSLMMRYVYYAMNPHVPISFSENVRLGTYGDDNAMSVKPGCGWFNHTSCQAEFAKLDIEYTMADKETKSVPYIPIAQINFLKRGFRFSPELGKIVAPIEEDSILKKFHYVKKLSECPLSFEEQFGAYTDGAFREAYLHGEEYYNQFQKRIIKIIEANDSLRGQVNIISFSEMTKVLKSDYDESYFYKPKRLYAELSITEGDEIRVENQGLSLPDDQVRLIEQKVKTARPSPTIMIIKMLLTIGACSFVSAEFRNWFYWRGGRARLLRRLSEFYDELQNLYDEKIDSAYELDGINGIMEELGVPFVVRRFLTSRLSV